MDDRSIVHDPAATKALGGEGQASQEVQEEIEGNRRAHSGAGDVQHKGHRQQRLAQGEKAEHQIKLFGTQGQKRERGLIAPFFNRQSPRLDKHPSCRNRTLHRSIL